MSQTDEPVIDLAELERKYDPEMALSLIHI